MYFLIEAELRDGTIYPLGVCTQAHSENDNLPSIVLHSRPLPEGTKIPCILMKSEDIRRRMFDLLGCLALRQRLQEYNYYILRVSKRAVALISASSQKDAEETAGKVNSLLPDGIRVTPLFCGTGPASDYPAAFGRSPDFLATHIQELLNCAARRQDGLQTVYT